MNVEDAHDRFSADAADGSTTDVTVSTEFPGVGTLSIGKACIAGCLRTFL